MGHQTRYLVFVEVSQASLSPASETGSCSAQGVDEAALQVAGGHLTKNSRRSGDSRLLKSLLVLMRP